MFFLIALTILGLIYGYTGWRIIPPLRLSLPWNLVAWTGLVLLLALPILLIVIRLRGHSLPVWLHDILAWTAYIGLGFAVLTFFLLAFRDLVWSGLSVTHRLLHLAGLLETATSPLTPGDPNRRLFLLNALNLGTVGLSATLSGYGLFAARSRLKVFEVSIPIPGLPEDLEGFRIVQFSDLHVGITIKGDFVESAVDLIETLTPDLIAFTGDLIDGEVEDLRHHVASLGRLSAPHGCFFITGNHEYYNDSTEGWLEEARQLGFTVLLNEHQLVERGKGRLLVAGVTDIGTGQTRFHGPSDPEGALADAPDAHVRLLLAHQPLNIEAAARAGYHLQLSGHTHGGQFIPWKYFIPLQQPFVAGLNRLADTWCYVNRGTGYWGPPLRLGAPAEITLLTLTRAPVQA